MAPYLDSAQHEGWHEPEQAPLQFPPGEPPKPVTLKSIGYGIIAIAILTAVLAMQAPQATGEKQADGSLSTTLMAKLSAAVNRVAAAITGAKPAQLAGTINDTKNAITTTPTPPTAAPTPSPTPDPCACPSVYTPVCGSDGITYYNACMARCKGKEVVSAANCVSTQTTTPSGNATATPTPSPSSTPSPTPSPTPTPYPDHLLGWYDVIEQPPFTNLTKLSQENSNFVLAYSWAGHAGGWGPAFNATAIRNYLDAAQQRGMKVVLEIPRNLINVNNLTGLGDYVRAVRGHPALAGYYSADEPDLWRQSDANYSPSNLQAIYSSIKQEDAQTPVSHVLMFLTRPNTSVYDCSAYGNPAAHQWSCIMSYGANRSLYNASRCGELDLCNLGYFEPSADVVMADYYAFTYDNWTGAVRNYTFFPYWPMDRTRAWGAYARQRGKKFVAVVQGTYYLDYRVALPPGSELDHPTGAEFRFYSIGNMLAGADGILAFVRYRVPLQVATGIVAPAYGDIKRFKRLFYEGTTLPCTPAGECGEVTARGAFDAGGEYLLGIMNENLTNARTVTLTLPFQPSAVKEYHAGSERDFTGLLGIGSNSVTLQVNPQHAALLVAR